MNAPARPRTRLREYGAVTPPQTIPPLILQSHPATPARVALAASVAMSGTPDGLQLVYTVAGDCRALRVPPAVENPGPTDGLWRHTCLEAFVAVEGEAAYHEFNFSPSGQWAVYRFDSERVRAADEPPTQGQPTIQAQASAERLALTAHLPWALLPAPGAVWFVGLSAVIEEADGRLSYWALQHPEPQPDFHHPAGRLLRLAFP